MEKMLKVISWVEVVLGGLAIVGSLSSEDFYQFVGGIMFLGAGLVALRYIKEQKQK